MHEELGIVGVAASGPGYLRGVDQRCGWSNRFVSAFPQCGNCGPIALSRLACGSDRPGTPGSSQAEHLIVDAGPSLYPQMPAGIQM